MNQFLNTCRRCLSPKVSVVIVVVIIGFLIVVPIIGVTSLVVALPLLGCTLMCGAMAFVMKGEKGKDK